MSDKKAPQGPRFDGIEMDSLQLHHPQTSTNDADAAGMGQTAGARTLNEMRAEMLRIQALGAALSRRDWHAAEQAYNAIRDEFDGRLCRTAAAKTGGAR